MKISELLPHIYLPDLIAAYWGVKAIQGLHHDRGGVICDQRPGQEEIHPSFSVFKSVNIWRWKRHGGDGASGNAYSFLLELGYSEQQAREELHRLAGVPLDGWQMSPLPRPTYTPPSALELARRALSRCAPLTADEQQHAWRLLAPLAEHDQAVQDLQARGLYCWDGLKAYKLRQAFQTRDGRTLGQVGALAFLLTGPDGQPWGLKVRNLGSKAELAAAGVERYAYRLARHGAPAWCSPDYGHGEALLIVEGELNGAAAARAAGVIGLSLDVQGLAGAGGVPYLNSKVSRVVYLYADPDAAGTACLEWVGQLAQEAGAAEVRVLARMSGGDFCDLLGRMGIQAFGSQVWAAMKMAQLWQPANSGKSALPQIKSPPREAKNDLWQLGTIDQGWAASDTSWSDTDSGWSLPGRGW
jgi:hypothetical protein